MNKNKIIIIACVLIGIGGVMAGAGYLSGGYKDLAAIKGFTIGWNSNDKDNQYVKEDEELEKFDDIDLDVDFGDVEIDEGDNYRIVAEHNEKYDDLSYSVKDNKLVVTNKQTVNFGVYNDDDSNFKIKIYVPKDTYLNNLKLEVQSGNLTLNNLKSKELNATNKFGNIKGNNIETVNFEGNLESGSLNLDTFTAENAVIKNKFGDVSGKSFVTNGLNADVESGKIDIEGNLSGQNEINSEFGKVILKTGLTKEECGYDINVEFGKSSVNGEKLKGEHESYNEKSNNLFKVKCSSGDVELDFNK